MLLLSHGTADFTTATNDEPLERKFGPPGRHRSILMLLNLTKRHDSEESRLKQPTIPAILLANIAQRIKGLVNIRKRSQTHEMG
jgi:hypothetical protein